MTSPRLVCLVQACLVLLSGAVRGAAGANFPPVTDEERALTSVPGEPNAPAVVLFKKGEFLLAGYGQQIGSLASSLRVQVRMKILTEEGKANGEVAIGHSDAYRLHGFQARTVLPDGRVIPVPSDAKFVRKTSRSRKSFVTAVAFPSVQVGAILDLLVEEKNSDKDVDQTVGRTDGNKIVLFPGDYRPGETVRVKVTAATPHALRGEALSSAATK